MKSHQPKSPIILFFIIFFISFIFSVSIFYIFREKATGAFLYLNGRDFISDFLDHLHYNIGQENGPWFANFNACFPAFAYSFYVLINDVFTLNNPFYELLAYTILTTATSVLMFQGIRFVTACFSNSINKPESTCILTLCFLLSGIFIFTIERGNSAFPVMVMLLFAIALRDSNKWWQREIALLLIAAAAGFKIYPCLFGLLYLAEKRYRESLRLIIYGLVLFFLPFFLFSGFLGFKQFLFNQLTLHSLSYGFITISSFAQKLTTYLPEFQNIVLMASSAARIVLALLLILCVFLSRELWIRILMICGFFVAIPGWCGEYVGLYFVIPFVLFLVQSQGLRSFRDYFYTILFSGIYILLPFSSRFFGINSGISVNMLISFSCIYFLIFFAIAETLVFFIRKKYFFKEDS